MICVGAIIPDKQILWEPGHSDRKDSPRLLKMESIGGGMASGALRPVMLTWGASGRVWALFLIRVLSSFLLLLSGIMLLLLLPFRRRTIVVATEEKQGTATVTGARRGAEEKREGMLVRVPAAMVHRRARELDVAARRVMAIRRVRGEEQGEVGSCQRDLALFSTERGDTLFTQSWSSVSVRTEGLVVLMHGLNEHSGRYNEFAKQLTVSGFKVYAMDWIGHGGSDGLHGYVHSLDYAVNDLRSFLCKVSSENPGLRVFCFGHSTGAAIVLKAILDPKIEACVEGAVLTSPAIRVQPSHPIIAVMAPIFSLVIPRYQFSAANKKGPPVSRDPEALKAKYSDPLVFTGSIRVRTGYEILRISNYLQQNLNKITIPFLVLHGTADTVTDPSASEMLYHEAASTDKAIKLYDGLLHDLLFEPEREDITEDILKWLRARVGSTELSR
ncbi:hypothetical protein HPP92_012663 [Vanilla planifolia]|uniref:Serine aminopeptidase S33 domain-containing protein n=1 Tax=Vanilla planifolia TaxID=51239 RepID=A0A835UVR8_VANPL|nr:hypothetical protein HPP92_012663 [Vanilla planifolia]